MESYYFVVAWKQGEEERIVCSKLMSSNGDNLYSEDEVYYVLDALWWEGFNNRKTKKIKGDILERESINLDTLLDPRDWDKVLNQKGWTTELVPRPLREKEVLIYFFYFPINL